MTDELFQRVLDALGDQYAIQGEIGRGGMSVVYRARDLRLNRPVAIKVLPPELAYDPAIRTRFTREAQTAAQLSHPHIVPIYDVGDRNGIAYFVMNLVAGGNLATLLAHEPRQPIDEVRRILSEVADALDFAHMRGVIHRDIKPDNILLDADTGRAMVTDFGIARAIEGGSRLTLTGIAVGTPTYMSPEQAVGEREVDGRSDIYSLGVVAYQMVTGRVPFSGPSSMALLLKHVSEQPKPVTELRPDTPRSLHEIIDRALMKSPEDRWPTAAAFRDALQSERSPSASWRGEYREPVRYTSPRPDAIRRLPRGDASASPRRGSAVAAGARPPQPVLTADGVVLEPAHLAALTPEQRQDLRLWNGRIHLSDRIVAMRWYARATLAMTVVGIGGAIASIVEGVPPGVLAALVPAYMMLKLKRRGLSLRQSGLKLRRVLLMPRAKWVVPSSPKTGAPPDLAQEVLEGPHGSAIRRALEARIAIRDILAKLPKVDRALLPELAPTVDSLVDRVAHLAQVIHRLEPTDARRMEQLDRRIAELGVEGESTDGERRLALLRRQRESLATLVDRRATLERQLENAILALDNLRLDLVKLRSSGLTSGTGDVSTATQEARALSAEIGAVLEAVAEVKRL